ncbi:hypothetical protein AAFF24_003577 [Enterobacter bugandensis]
MSIITTERLTKILSETQAVISECNARGVHGSVEVNARLFENVLMELLQHRAAMLHGAEPVTTAYKLRDAVETIRNSGIEIDAEKIFAERDALNSPVIPDGWKLVPVELTGAMTNAMTDAILDDLHNVDVWRSVLAAAPQQEVK